MNYKYYLIQSSNGNISIISEWNDLNSAIVAYHDRCKVLWNAQDVITGYVAIMDTQLDVVQGYKEFISHPVPEPVVEEPEPEE